MLQVSFNQWHVEVWFYGCMPQNLSTRPSTEKYEKRRDFEYVSTYEARNKRLIRFKNKF